MARLAEDSDDDFPTLANISRVNRGDQRPTERGPEAQLQRTKITPTKPTISKYDAAQTVGLREGTTKQIVRNPKLRRRALNNGSDNPLLRPLYSADPSNTSSSLLKDADVSLDAVSKHKIAPREAVWPAKPQPAATAEDKDYSCFESSSLSDFIVNDSSYLSEADSEDRLPPPPPRSFRRLVRGLKQENVNSKCQSEEIDGKSSFRHSNDFRIRPDLSTDDSDSDREMSTRQNVKDVRPESRSAATSSGLDEPMAILSFSPPQAQPSVRSIKEIRFATPPPSPQKQNAGLVSPKKLPRIPLTPHRPSMDGFWSQEVVNEWNDEFSPRKTPKAGVKLKKGERNDVEESLGLPVKKVDARKSKSILNAKKDFNRRKQEIAANFLLELDETITDGKLALLSESTGGVKILWSKKLNTTAGRANWKRETIREKTAPEETKVPKLSYRHHASIELSEKVIDDENRLLNVIAHEFCHLANFMVSGIKNNPHGKEFKIWAAKCSLHFGHRGIEVTTKHSYEIDYKYIWECTNCGTEFKRHSKSIDPTRHQCGSCKSKLVQIKPVPRAEGKLGEYQTFVKENMKLVRERNPGSPQKVVMELMGKLYQDSKTEKLKEGNNEAGSAEGSSVDGIDAVSRKLDFLDLTSE